MIKIENKRACCGCKACEDVCPKTAISFSSDDEGFWYPKVDLSRCIDCHLCERICPILHNRGLTEGNSEKPATFILQHKSTQERFDSTSGAAYPAIARFCLMNGIYVAGHIFNEDYTVRGYVTNRLDDLEILRKSKYLQSDMQGVYTTVKTLLKKGERVLFSGCPCQIAAMKTFVGKDCDGLLTIDFTCMGIDSPLAFKKYIESMERLYGAKMVYFKSKSKETGWRDLTNKMIFENGKAYFGARTIDPNLKATFLDILMRPSCFECKFKGLPRIADITIGDYWHKRDNIYDVHIDDNTGTSYYMANSSIGLNFLNSISDLFRCEEKDVEDLFKGNPYMFKCLPEPTSISRAAFYESIKERDFKEVVDELFDKAHKQSRINLIAISLLRAFKRYKYNPLRFIRFLYYNVFCRKVKVDLASSLFLIWDSVKLDLSKNSKIEVNGICTLGRNKGPSGILRMGEGSVLTIDSVESEGSSLDFTIERDAKLSIGYRSIIGRGADISVAKSVSIGEFSFLGSNTFITDNNSMTIRTDEDSLMIESTIIGAHCLVGENSVITRGARVGDEVIIEPNSKVVGVIPPRVVISGCPAQIIKESVLWKK